MSSLSNILMLSLLDKEIVLSASSSINKSDLDVLPAPSKISLIVVTSLFL